VLRALCEALAKGALPSRFLGGSGFSFVDVHMSPDLRRAYVRWSVLPGLEERMQRELARRCGGPPLLLAADRSRSLSAVPLRSAVAKLVALRHTPELHFRCSAAESSTVELEELSAWEQLDREREEEEKATAELREEVVLADEGERREARDQPL